MNIFMTLRPAKIFQILTPIFLQILFENFNVGRFAADLSVFLVLLYVSAFNIVYLFD